MNSTSNRVAPRNRVRTTGWAIYNNEDGALIYFAPSRQDVRDYKNSFEDSSHMSGPRRVNMTVNISSTNSKNN